MVFVLERFQDKRLDAIHVPVQPFSGRSETGKRRIGDALGIVHSIDCDSMETPIECGHFYVDFPR